MSDAVVVPPQQHAGFWTRFAACSIDLVVVYVAVRLAVEGAAAFSVYVPREAAFLCTWFLYSCFFIGWRGATLGKNLCGLRVLTRAGTPVKPTRAALRETLAKIVSSLFLLVGFLWIAFTRSKRGWHDAIAATIVVKDHPRSARASVATAAGWLLALVAITLWAYEPLRLYLDSRHLSVPSTVRPPYLDRDPALLTDVAQIGDDARTTMADWLRQHGQDPVDYVVQVAAAHQLTIIGEVHEVRENLQFLNRLIPDLYHRAGVTCIAMEAINATDNRLVEQIVTNQTLDRDAILQVARRNAWKAWGWKEYWDVLETVWRLNRSLPPGSKPMRLVGIFPTIDLPSFALAGLGDSYRGKRPPPPWERLRLARVLDDMLVALSSDAAYARNAEEQIFDKQERGIVWVGAGHAPLRHRYPSPGPHVREHARMGFMLHQKYQDRVSCVLLHNDYSVGPNIPRLIEEAAVAGGKPSVGFPVPGSPFATLRDGDAYPYRCQPGACLADMVDGYVLLKPTRELHRCQWIDGYISPTMFAKDKPFYEMQFQQPIADYLEADRLFRESTRMLY